MGDILSGRPAGAEPPWRWPRAAYVHVPFCAYHCGYCDFAVVAGQDDRIDDYLVALDTELSTLGEPTPVRTLFLGGGTPTHLPPDRLERLLVSITRWLPLVAGDEETSEVAIDSSLPPSGPLPPCGGGLGWGVRIPQGSLQQASHNESQPSVTRTPHPNPPPQGGRGPDGGRVAEDFRRPEFSVEANPDTLTPDKVAVLAAHGVTRVSLGAQSFHPHLLRTLDRAHDPTQIARAVETARRHIGEVSLDLIFGIPDQTPAQWEDDLRHALELAPDHLSTYGLTYEKGTPLWKRRRRGELLPLSEDAELAQYATAIDTLTAAGFEHYEVSNFARPGRRCRHNETYWANEAYFGFGVGAARYVRGRREVNTRDLTAYIQKARAGEPCAFQSEELDPTERAKETMAVQLRRCDGIDRAAFHAQTGYHLNAVAGPRLATLVEQGFLADDGRRVCLTRAGKYVADGIIERLL